MDVSNSTDQDTQYRLAGGGGKTAATWQLLPKQSRYPCCNPTGSWTIEFLLADGTVVSHSFNHPKAIVELVKTGKHYKIRAHQAAA
jgi:hypothetical protein